MTQDRTNRRAFTIVVIGLAVALLGCVSFAYLWIDRSISLAYLDSSYRTSEQGYARVSALLEREWVGLSEEEVLTKLETEAGKHPQEKILVKRELSENMIWFDNVRFEFESGKLNKIR